MAEETTTSSPANSTETPSEIVAPSDFREYVKWRQTGEQPAEEQPAAAEETPQAKSEPQSGTEVTGQEESEEETAEAKPGRPGSRQRKIDRLTRENEMLRQQLVQASQPRPAEKPAESAPARPAEAPGKPKLQDFSTLEAYQEALTDWKLDQREAKRKADDRQAAALAEAQRIQTAWSSSEQAARAAHPDYDEVLQSVAAPTGPGVEAATQAMREDEAGPEVLYHLATHREEMERIAAMQPIAAIKAIGRLAAMFAEPPPVPNGKPKVSSAPKPPAPMSRQTGQTVKDSIYDENVAQDFTRWNRARIAQLKGK